VKETKEIIRKVLTWHHIAENVDQFTLDSIVDDLDDELWEYYKEYDD
jgi:hypothetical protein